MPFSHLRTNYIAKKSDLKFDSSGYMTALKGYRKQQKYNIALNYI